MVYLKVTFVDCASLSWCSTKRIPAIDLNSVDTVYMSAASGRGHDYLNNSL